jgi:hypothetical protein
MLGILCGFEAEAKVARQISPLVACSGAVESIARQCAEELVRKGATHLMSFGLAGGLSPTLSNRSLVIADRITNGHEEWWRCDETLLAHLKHALPAARVGAIYGSKDLVPDPIQKQVLFERTKCLIVDMESQVVAEVGAKHGLPVCGLRGVSDTVHETFPPAALVGINPDGSMNIPAILKSVLANRAQIPALMRLGQNTKIVLKNLTEAAPAVKQALSQPLRAYSAATVA